MNSVSNREDHVAPFVVVNLVKICVLQLRGDASCYPLRVNVFQKGARRVEVTYVSLEHIFHQR